MKIILLAICLATSMATHAEHYPVLDYKVFGSPTVTSGKSAIDNLMTELWDARSKHDATTFANLHSKDAEWTNAFGRTFRGTKALEIFLEERLFTGFDIEIAKQEAQSYSEISRRYIGAEAVIITGRTNSNRGSSVGTSNRKIGFTFVLAKTNGEWKVTNQVITDIRERRG